MWTTLSRRRVVSIVTGFGRDVPVRIARSMFGGVVIARRFAHSRGRQGRGRFGLIVVG
jgi:hypothetical protein